VRQALAVKRAMACASPPPMRPISWSRSNRAGRTRKGRRDLLGTRNRSDQRRRSATVRNLTWMLTSGVLGWDFSFLEQIAHGTFMFARQGIDRRCAPIRLSFASQTEHCSCELSRY
jgi:hypothetical protein